MKNVSDALRDALSKFKNIIKNTSSDDKPALTEIYDELQSVAFLIADEHAVYQETLNTINDLRKKVTELEKWDETQSQYTLRKLTLGVLVFAPNESHKSPKPLHWLCVKCFNDHKKSMLQLQEREGPVGRLVRPQHYLDCPECKTSLKINIDDSRALISE